MPTLTEQILSRAAIREVAAGDIVTVPVDIAMVNDITGPVAVNALADMGADRVFDPDKVVIVLDHFLPARDVVAATAARDLMMFADEQGIKHCYGPGKMGIEHVLLPELGLIGPGKIVIGADSHTCTGGAVSAFATGVGSTDLAGAWALGTIWLRVPATIRVELTGDLGEYVGGKDVILSLIGRIGVEGANYQALEFGGAGLGCLSMDSRFAIANMAVECGGKNAMFEIDNVLGDYLKETGHDCHVEWEDSSGWDRFEEIDLGEIVPLVAAPHSPDIVMPAVDSDAKVDQVVIGSCTNGRLEDLKIASDILTGKVVADRVRLLVTPATPKVFKKALSAGYIQALADAGAVICPPSCGPCLGGHSGVVAGGETVVATTNRNFRGRMGSVDADIYLAGPAVAAATAVTGRISDPREVLS